MIPAHLARLTVDDTWARIDRWLERYPSQRDRLEGPLAEHDIDSLARALGVTLPDDYRASLRIHAGGRTRPTNDGTGLWADSPFDAVTLFSPRLLLARRERLMTYEKIPFYDTARVSGAIQRAYHHRGWIPVAETDHGAIYYCLDTVPTDPSAYGQIVEMITNDSDRRVPWRSFRELLIDTMLVPIETMAVDEDALAEDGILRFVERA